jgi:folate-binding protein YgfZ
MTIIGSKMNFLLKRSIIEISGSDSKKFLQGLLTNDINKVGCDSIIYSAMLNPKGQFLYDFFIHQNGEKILLDCAAQKCDEIIKKLNFYKLRSQVEIKKNDTIFVSQSLENIGLEDSRSKNLGNRIYSTRTELEKISTKLLTVEEYDFLRIKNKIAEGEADLTYEKSFILEFGFNELNAVDYNKGCYVGQELTARTHHLGEIRKKIFHIKILGEVDLKNLDSLKNREISCEGKKLGVILSSSFYKNELHALALIRIAEYENRASDVLESENLKISVIS